MANKKISELPAAGALTGAELIETVQGGVNKQTTTQDIADLGGAGGGHTIEDEGTPLTQRTKLNFVGSGVTVTDDSGDDATVVTIPSTDISGKQDTLTAANFGDFLIALTDKTTPVDADSIVISDSAATGDAKEVTYANLKATLKSYFDTQYDAIAGAFTINNYTASHILAIGDAGDLVEMEVGTDNTLTVPPNSDVAFAVGTVIEGVQKGAGQTTITAGSGVTIYSKGAYLKTVGQYSPFCLVKIATDTWYAFGDLTS